MDTSATVSQPKPRNEASESDATLSDRVRSLRLPSAHNRLRRPSPLPWVIVVLLMALVSFLGYREYERGDLLKQPGATPAVATQPTPDATTATPETGAVNRSTKAPDAVPDSGKIALESKGYLVPAHQILVSPKVSGMVLKLYIEEGMRVEKGQVLGELEKVDYEADLRRARAVLAFSRAKRDLMLAGSREEEREQVKAELAEAERQLAQLKAEHERNISLRKRGDTLITDADFEEQESEFEVAIQKVKRLSYRRDQVLNGNRREEIAAAEAEVEQAEAEVQKAEWRISNCTIVAPISGTVLKKNAEEGNIVNPVAFNGSFSLCDLADLSDLEVDLSIQERDVSKVYPRQGCQIRSEAYPDRVYEGYVDRLMPIADRAKGAIPVRVKVKVAKAEEGIYLKPDMSAVVTFLNEKVPAAPSSEGK